MTFELKISFSAERDAVGLEFPQGLKLSAPDIEHLILTLAKVRATLLPGPGADAPAIDPDHLIHDPRWRSSQCTQAEEGAYIQIQHPGFGWLQFRLPRRELAKLGSFLETVAGTARVNQPSAEDGSPPPRAN